MSFRNILLITGATTALIGAFVALVNYIPVIDVPSYSHKGNLVTGIILSFIGIYIFLLGIFDNRK